MNRIYLDHAATTPLDPEVLESMLPYFSEKFGNPSSVHKFGQEAHVALNIARQTAAKALGCLPDEIIFTGGATESNNTILKGFTHTQQGWGRHIITSMIEHDSVLETCSELEYKGFTVTYLPPNKEGIIETDTVRNALRKDTILISIMAANNEIGTIQSIAEIGKIAKQAGIFFHTDAVQYYPYFPCNVGTGRDLSLQDINALTLSAHKFFGPKGVGLLYVKKGTAFIPLLHGGGQEFGLRAGTQNIPGIVGLGKAMELVEKNREKNAKQVEQLRDYLLKEIQNKITGTRVNGGLQSRLPGNLNISFEGLKGEDLMIRLDLAGIAVSTGSACSSFDHAPSHVLKALGLSAEEAEGSIRISLGKNNTKKEMDVLLEELEKTVKALRRTS